MRKKIGIISLTIAVVAMMAVSLCACGGDKGTTTYDIPTDLAVSVEVLHGEQSLGTISKATLAKVQQEQITMTTTNKTGTMKTVVYVCYNLKSLCEKANIVLPEFTSVKGTSGTYSKDCGISSFENSYISIGIVENGAFAIDEKSPRFISDKTSSSSNSIVQQIETLVLS